MPKVTKLVRGRDMNSDLTGAQARNVSFSFKKETLKLLANF